MTEQPERNRFKGSCYTIDMEVLEHESQKLLFLGMVFAVAFHAMLGSYFMFRKSEVLIVKPPTMELVIRRPRMSKPFEFKKERLKHRDYVRREIQHRKPIREIKTKQIQAILGKVTSFDSRETKLEVMSGSDFFAPSQMDIPMVTIREPENQINMKEELISLDDLDTGQYKAMIIQDPGDKKSIKGFIYISTLWGAQFEPAHKRAILHLSDAVNRFTGIRSKVDKHLFIDSRKLFECPFVFLCVDEGFELTGIEAKNFGEYLRRGGFAVLDNGTPTEEYGAAEASLKNMLTIALGNDAKFLPIPSSHPLYHCYEDFNSPPNGSEIDYSMVVAEGLTTYKNRGTMSKQVLYLEGIWIDDRLVAVYSDKGYAAKWAENSNNEPQLKMGVNMVVFALTQDGSIAQQRMDFFTAGR